MNVNRLLWLQQEHHILRHTSFDTKHFEAESSKLPFRVMKRDPCFELHVTTRRTGTTTAASELNASTSGRQKVQSVRLCASPPEPCSYPEISPLTAASYCLTASLIQHIFTLGPALCCYSMLCLNYIFKPKIVCL